MTLTAEPWALTREAVEDAARQGLDDEQVEAAVGVISMFNYFTRVADATGIEFDYVTPLPAFEPDLGQVTASRPDRPGSSSQHAGRRRRPRHPQLQAAWESWRTYVLEAEEPISRRERRLLASVAAEEAAGLQGGLAFFHPQLQAVWQSWRAYVLEADQPINRRVRWLLASVAAEEAADWEGAEALGGSGAGADGDGPLVRFARKLSRQPWRMEEGDLEGLRASGYSEEAVLHMISVVAHQSADSRLAG